MQIISYFCTVKLSIIVPVYRVEATLDRCLTSVVSQSFADFEIILVDDGSPDRCPQICDEWAVRDERIKVIHQANAGLSAARNTGLTLAQGEYLTFIDSDDYIAEGTLEAVMGEMADNDILEYPVWCFFGSHHQSLLSFESKSFSDMHEYWLQGRAYLHTYAWNKIYRRHLFQTVRYPVGKVFEDAYTLPLLLHHARQVKTSDKGLYYYCWNKEGITALARGKELRMLLDAHLTSGMPMDDRYYMHLLNIQMDVYELTGDAPTLSYRRIKPFGNIKQVVKAIALNILGIKGICKTNKIIHKLLH